MKYIAGILILVGAVLVFTSGFFDLSRGMEGLWNPTPMSSTLHQWGFSILGLGTVFAILSVFNREH